MSSHIGLIASIVIGSIVLLAILNMNSEIHSRSYETLLDNLVTENTKALAEMFTKDINKIGYGVESTNPVFGALDSSSIEFYADIDADDVIDTVKYSIDYSTFNTATPNPRDRILSRQVNQVVQNNIGVGVTAFKVTYYDKNGIAIMNPATIATIGIELTVESTYSCTVHDSIYFAQNNWQTRISPPNLLK